MVLKAKIEKSQIEEVRQKAISLGAPVNADKQEKKEWLNFCLRIKNSMLDQIDEALDDRPGMSKTGWILEAIHEKLKRRNKNDI